MEVSDVVLSKMIFIDGTWSCTECDWKSKYKTRTFEHVEAMHVETGGYHCQFCDKFCKSFSALKMHKSRYHKQLK